MLSKFLPLDVISELLRKNRVFPPREDFEEFQSFIPNSSLRDEELSKGLSLEDSGRVLAPLLSDPNPSRVLDGFGFDLDGEEHRVATEEPNRLEIILTHCPVVDP